ncbi:MacB-like core domain-containing protein [Sphingobacterium nematocida]|uniref:MacB-like core domain-containing protein n=1 Tax=Sphingobacterium nematocida TaxID=1513896 RepID=A0A1T5BIG0_9SPHI|nr:ABC transporter permease [Sphingobacterium nematocida]SKB46593.1 MacB-like core domain-containing protein [Sphingobacterium nematocida]
MKNVIFSTWRNIRKRKLQTFIQISSLTLAFAVGVILFLSASFELSFDNFHQNSSRIGALYFEAQENNNQRISDPMPVPLAPTLKQELSYIEKASRMGNGGLVLKANHKEISIGTRYVDPDFFSIFTFEMLAGNKHALDEKNNIVLSQSTAKSLFGASSNSLIGQQVEVNIAGKWQNMQISAIVKDPPSNSSLKFQSLLSFEQFPNAFDKNSWSNKNHSVFVLSSANKIDVKKFEQAVKPLTEKYFAADIAKLKRDGASPNKDGSYLSLSLVPFQNYHLNDLQIGNTTNPLLPKLLLGLALLILIISVSNFVNIQLVTAISRSQEVAIKKTLGGTSIQISLQLWLETLIFCTVSLILGLILAWVLIPFYNANTHYRLKLDDLFSWTHLMTISLSFLIISFIAGGYPALRITRQSISTLVKGKSDIRTRWSIQKILPLIQFTIAIVLVVCSVVVVLQINHIKQMPLGFEKQQVISIPIGPKIDANQALQKMRLAVSSNPLVTRVTASDINLGLGRDGSQSTSQLGFDYQGKGFTTNWQRVDFDYFSTLDIPLIAGRGFSTERAADSTALVINEKMAAQLGGVENILNKPLPLFDKQMTVIGVVKDYNFKDLRQGIQPLSLFIDPNLGFDIKYILVRVKSTNLVQSLKEVESIWKTIYTDYKNDASYLDENTDRMYEQEQQMMKIISAGGIIAVIIACMGLFAAALVAISARVREIGIRKVLGSTIWNLVLLLSKDFLRIVALSLLLGLPIAWYISSEWLNTFSYRFHFHFGILILCALAMMALACITICIHTIKAASLNPVNSLRDQ